MKDCSFILVFSKPYDNAFTNCLNSGESSLIFSQAYKIIEAIATVILLLLSLTLVSTLYQKSSGSREDFASCKPLRTLPANYRIRKRYRFNTRSY